jgi:DNA-directed RNA polymerase alpha subunit
MNLVEKWKKYGLSTRAANILANMEYTSLKQVKKLTFAELNRLPNCGSRTTAEIKFILFGDVRQSTKYPLYVSDEALISELEARGYLVHKRDREAA